MSPYKPTSDIDAAIRSLFEPDAAAVQRVLAAALGHAGDEPRRRTRWAWAGGAVTAILLLTTGVWQWRQPSHRSTGEPQPLTTTGNRAVVVVERADGQRWAITPAQDDASRGNYVIVIER